MTTGRPGLARTATVLTVAMLMLAIPGGALRSAGADDPDGPSAQASPTPDGIPADIGPRELVPLLTRSGIGPDQTLIDVIYAPPLFFEATGIPAPAEMETRPTLAFILQESVHDGDLPVERPDVFLLLADGERVAPFAYELATEDEHHRTSRVLFPRPEGWPAAASDESGEHLVRVIVPFADGSVSLGNTFTWTIPVTLAGTSPQEPIGFTR